MRFNDTACLLCHAPCARALSLCDACYQDLPWIRAACRCCGIELPASRVESAVCGNCIVEKPLHTQTIALFNYAFPITALITSMKFSGQLAVADALGRLLALRVAYHYADSKLPDFIIPVPLHEKRLLERGFNQAQRLALPVSRRLRIPIEQTLIQRSLPTPAQSGALNAAVRRQNLRNAFNTVAGKKLNGAHIAIIDDVITTQATINSVTQALSKLMPAQIDVWCIARTA
jgi:ComF family protein